MLESLKNLKRRLTLGKKARRHELVGNPKNWKLKRDFQIQFLKQSGLKPSHTVLDVGCGTLRGGIPIIKYLKAGNYWGIDVRDEVVQEGLAELAEEHLTNKAAHVLSFEDFDTLELDERFDFVLAFSVLIHLTDPIASSCFNFVSRHLAGNGVFYANVNIDDRDTGQWLEFPVMHKSLEFYTNLAGNAGLKMSEVGLLRDLGHNTGDDHADNQVMLAFTAE